MNKTHKNTLAVLLFVIILSGLILSNITTSNATDVLVKEDNYTLVFSDEFDLPDGSQPNEDSWSCSPRMQCTWARWVSNSPEVVYIQDGSLVCRALRNSSNPADTALMLTGAVETRGKYSFQYGKIEVRAKTNLHDGNFPAIWLMPQPPAPRHPNGGEIDIFESFGKEDKAQQTIHTHWTLNLKHDNKPKNKFVKAGAGIDEWHVYGLVWTPDRLVFTIDGEVSGEYAKADDEEALANEQWPFDRPFYIILNQSLLSFGTHRKSDPDPDYVYETMFDWVRVYQKKEAK